MAIPSLQLHLTFSRGKELNFLSVNGRARRVVMKSSRRGLFTWAGVGIASVAALSIGGTAHAQVAEEANTDPLILLC